MINLHESMGPGRNRTRNPWSAVRLATDYATGPNMDNGVDVNKLVDLDQLLLLF